MNDLDYVYEGTCEVKCQKCGFKHTVFYTGDHQFHPEEAIKSVLMEEKWEVDKMLCPECYDVVFNMDSSLGGIDDELDIMDEYGYDDWDEEED